MKVKKSNLLIASAGLSALFLTASIIPAFAQTNVSGLKKHILGADLNREKIAKEMVSSTINSTSTKMMRLDERANNEINQRIKNLNSLSSRIEGMKKISDSQKSSIKSIIENEITELTTLKNKVAGDTDPQILKTDMQLITKSYRVYALIMPQISITAAADRALNLADAMTTLAGKLQTRISSAQSAGKDVSSMQSVLSDMNAKISDAKTQAQAAESEISSLVPDQGDQAKLQANMKALKDARTKIKFANEDLKTARKDAGKIVMELRAMNKTNNSSASSTGSQ